MSFAECSETEGGEAGENQRTDHAEACQGQKTGPASKVRKKILPQSPKCKGCNLSD